MEHRGRGSTPILQTPWPFPVNTGQMNKYTWIIMSHLILKLLLIFALFSRKIPYASTLFPSFSKPRQTFKHNKGIAAFRTQMMHNMEYEQLLSANKELPCFDALRHGSQLHLGITGNLEYPYTWPLSWPNNSFCEQAHHSRCCTDGTCIVGAGWCKKTWPKQCSVKKGIMHPLSCMPCHVDTTIKFVNLCESWDFLHAK